MDTVPPAISLQPVSPNPRNTAVSTIDITFSGRSLPNRFRYRCSMNCGSGAFHGS